MKHLHLLFAILTMAVGNSLQAFAGEQDSTYTVTVTEPGTFGLCFLQVVGGEGGAETTDNDWRRVKNLTIKGKLNASDYDYFYRMTNMETLDVSEVTGMRQFTGCKGLTALKKVVLAEEMKTIGYEAFKECKYLKEINTDQVDSVLYYGFNYCHRLKGGNYPELKYIGSCGFSSCDSLKGVDMPKCEKIENDAFSNCDYIKYVNAPLLKEIGNWGFYGCDNLASVIISDETKIIPNRCFVSCAKLKEFHFPTQLEIIQEYAFTSAGLEHITLPEGLKRINANAFTSVPYVTVTLPSTLQFISSNAFRCANKAYDSSLGRYTYYLTDVYNYAISPYQSYTTFISQESVGATLHVPAMSIGNYKLASQWYNFNQTVPLETDMDNMLITSDYYIISAYGIADKANLTVRPLIDPGESYYFDTSYNSWAHLTISSTSDMSFGTYHQVHDMYNNRYTVKDNDNGTNIYWNSFPYVSSMIAKTAARADVVKTTMRIPRNEWLFISFPFDVKVGDITVDDNVLWTIRRYSGANRASGEGSTWESLAATDIMNAHEGYILQCSSTNEYEYFTFPAQDNDHKNTLFSTGDITVPLTEYAAEFANNRSWNLVGNPFQAYFYIQELDYNGPVTARYTSGYQAYTPWDDEYVFHPNEAFFVQAPIGVSSMTFRHDGAQHTFSAPERKTAQRPHLVAARADRSVFNIVMSDGDNADRTRIAYNDEASADYELTWDAEKMTADGGQQVQIYSLLGEVKMAINEMPAQQEPHRLGYSCGSKTRATISLNTKNATQRVTLTDHLTGQTTVLTDGSYSFDTEAGVFDNRFTVVIADDGITAVSGIDAETQGMTYVYSADGKLIKTTSDANSLDVAPGLYVVKTGGKAKKVTVK